ncbi:hypothetical protein LZ30DRAFT_581424 [Colletotrichum cereale]|nr:hypothetical protein LZ30DRAFT_581424 [Colletotrichum cereale]
MFTDFKKLPAEIRTEIWKLAFGSGHVVSAEALVHTPAAATMANRESWGEHTKHAFLVTLGGGRVYFDPKTDIVVYSRLTERPPCQDDPRFQNDIHREYRRHVATTDRNRRQRPPLLPQPIVNPHPDLRTAMIITGLTHPVGYTPMTWECLTHYTKSLIDTHKRDPILKLPHSLLADFPALETLWRVGSCPWSCMGLANDYASKGKWPPKFFEFRYYSASGRVTIREMPKPVRREFWRIHMNVTRSRIPQAQSCRVVVAIRIIRKRDFDLADMADGWRIVRTYEEESAGRQGAPEYHLLPDRLWWRILGGEIGRYIG